MQRKEAERTRSRELRIDGWSMRRIAAELGVSLASVSLWVRDLPTPPPAPRPMAPRRHRPARTELTGSYRCPRCDTTLPLSAFNRNGEGHQGWCRECFRTYFKERGALHRQQSAASKKRRVEKATTFLDDYLRSSLCTDCGEGDPDILEFDHVGEKRGHLAVLAGNGWSLKVLRDEIAQCEVVCVNCHRRRSYARQPCWRVGAASPEDLAPLTPHERRNVEFVRDLLRAGHCVDCGVTDVVVLEFDHIGVKTGNVCQLARGGCSAARLKAEIAQCEIRCANCHRRRTRVQLGHRRRARAA